MRTNFAAVRRSRIPGAIGIDSADRPTLASYVNEAQWRLLQAAGEAGWWGTWARMAFTVSRDDPFITVPREVARLIDIDVCRIPVMIQNQFYEFLQFGVGEQKPDLDCQNRNCNSTCGVQAYDRGEFPTFKDITSGSMVRVYMTNPADNTKRIFFSGTNSSGLPIYTIDGGNQVNGFFLNLDSTQPFVEYMVPIGQLTAISKDITYGPVQVFDVNLTTGDQTLIAVLAPGETTASYRRYYLQGLPRRCCECDVATDEVQVAALAKLDMIPVTVDTDYLLISNIPALKEECLSIRYGEMDTAEAFQAAEVKHKKAIRLLNQELIHYLGKQLPAIGFKPFGYDTLERAGLQMI